MTILVGFPLSHEGNLLEFLTLLSDLHSSSYHHYLTQAEFDERYGGRRVRTSWRSSTSVRSG